jgi:dehydrogenase/reductase SDR family protein 7
MLVMIVPSIRNAVAAGTAAFALAFATSMDANPKLYLHDRFCVNDDKLREYFDGKNIWITGASSGIGESLAHEVSRLGARKLILTGRSRDRLQSVADACSQHQSDCRCFVVPLDMAAPQDEFEAAVEHLQEILGNEKLDCVMLNAGVGQLRPAAMTPGSVTQAIFQVNTLAPISISQLLLARGILKEDRGRHIVVTSSIGAVMGVPLSASYAASKHALHGYFRSLKGENPWLRIDLICPGPVDTSFHSNHREGIASHPGSSSGTTGGTESEDVRGTSSTGGKLKMSVKRCTRLFLSSLLLGNGGEHWIAEQPTLAGLYVNQYFPGMFQLLLNKVGPFRVSAWNEGKDLYDPKTWKDISRR